jgi:thiamine-phosphate diphosphorylase / hydroxyethylthiazole kinase
LREILKLSAAHRPRVRTVAIGGLNSTNISRVRYQSETPSAGVRLDGMAIVSAMMSAPNPTETASELRKLFDSPPPFVIAQSWQLTPSANAATLKDEMINILAKVQQETPLVHHLTNNVSLVDFPANSKRWSRISLRT